MKETNQRVVVVGAGVMGYGIAQIFAQGGFQVSLVDISQGALDKASHLIQSGLKTMADENFLEEPAQAILDRLTFTTSLEDGARDADVAIEAIFENVEAKKALFAQMDKCCPPRALLASNTSYLNIFNFVETSRPDKVMITHWYSPPELIPLVDVVGGPETDSSSLESMAQILRRIGKRPVLMKKYISGYAINRLQHAMLREIHFLLDNDYVTPEQLDEGARVGLAFRMMVLGVVARIDFSGVSMRTRHPIGYEEVPLDYEYKKLRQLVDAGHSGVKSGHGFYDYKNKSPEEMYRERDIRLIEIAKTLKKLEAMGPLIKP
jgi:3-hydroxybutyryl-CoA dehydrogenase